MKPFMTTKNPKLLDPIRKYWYLCFLYIIFSYLLIRIIVIGSSKIVYLPEKRLPCWSL